VTWDPVPGASGYAGHRATTVSTSADGTVEVTVDLPMPGIAYVELS